MNRGVYSLFALILLSAIARLCLSTSLVLVHAPEVLNTLVGYFRTMCCKSCCRRKREWRPFLTVSYLRGILDWFISLASVSLIISWSIRDGISTSAEWQLAVVIAFLNWAHFILWCDKLPIVGTYVVMFRTILITFLKVSLFGLLLVLMFSVVLVALFNELVLMVSCISYVIH